MSKQITQTSSQLPLKYRPSFWDGVKGQAGIVKGLQARSKKDNWPTVTLLQGPTGVGKTTVAFIQAAAMQCNHLDEEGNPCGECDSCKDIFGHRFTRGGTMLLDSGTSGKDEVVEMMNIASHTKPVISKKHVFIVEEIDLLSPAAKNALHKILENPSRYIHFILLSMTDSNSNGKVPPSIADRAVPYHFKPLVERDIAYVLKDICEKEGKWGAMPPEFKKEGIFLIVNNAGGSLRRALKYLDRVLAEDILTVAELEEAFQFLSETTTLDILRALIEQKDEVFVRALEDLRRKTDLVEWMTLVSYFFLRFEESELMDRDFDTSPAVAYLRKCDPYKRQLVGAEILQLFDSMRGGFVTPTLLARKMLFMYKKIKHASTMAATLPTRS